MSGIGPWLCRRDFGAHWGYSGHDSPEYWGGELSDNYRACSTGRSQSPIDITRIGGTTDGIVIGYEPTAVNLVNNGHTIQLNYQPGSRLVPEGQEYELLQLHFHSPSQYIIEGRHFPLEMHLVHKNAAGKLATAAGDIICICIQINAEVDGIKFILNQGAATGASQREFDGRSLCCLCTEAQRESH